MSSAIFSHGCLDDTQKCISGLKSDESSRLPTVNPMTPVDIRLENMLEPQREQEPRSRVSDE
jgi:hypothetical protein